MAQKLFLKGISREKEFATHTTHSPLPKDTNTKEVILVYIREGLLAM